MRSLQLQNGELIPREVSRPRPREGEVSVRVFAAGITLTEVLWYPTTHTRTGAPRASAVPAHEFSGEIDSGPEQGHAVYGMNDAFDEGALAEYCVTRPQWIAPKPQSLDHASAAAVPIAALTAWQGLFQHGALKPGERILIHGGAGSVGTFATQLAHQHGAHVIATASDSNLDFVRTLGADEAIDYRAVSFDKAVRDIDVVFDCVGGDTLRRSWSVLRGGGRVVTIAASSESTLDPREKAAFFIVEPDRGQLIDIGRRIDAGTLRVIVDRVIPFTLPPKDYGSLHAQRGKIVMVLVGHAAFSGGAK